MSTYHNGQVNPEFKSKPQLESEMYGGEIYEYYPLGKHIVAAPGVCGGRPTFKYTRLEVSMILSRLAVGDTVADILQNYSQSRISAEAISEAIQFARDAMLEATFELRDRKKPILSLIAA